VQPIKTTGLVIRATQVGDYNKMLTVLTADLGKISVWAKGVRSVKNPLMPLCSTLCYSEMLLLSKGDAYTLTGGSVQESFYHLRDDVKKLACGIYFADIAGSVCEEGIPADEVLRLTLNSLHYLEKDKKTVDELKCMFELRLMSEAGLMPQLSSCVECGKEECTRFDPETGGAVCSACAPVGSLHISPEALKRAEHYVAGSLKHAFDTEAGQYLGELATVSEEYVKFHLGRKIKTLEYLKMV